MLCFTLVTKASDKCNQNGAMLYYLKGFHVQVTTKRFEVLFSCMQERSSSPRDSLFKISSSDCHSCFSSFKVLKHDTIKIWDFQVIKEKSSWFWSFSIFYLKLTTPRIICPIKSYLPIFLTLRNWWYDRIIWYTQSEENILEGALLQKLPDRDWLWNWQETDIDLFHATGLFLHPLNLSENLWYSDASWGWRNKVVVWNGLIMYCFFGTWSSLFNWPCWTWHEQCKKPSPNFVPKYFPMISRGMEVNSFESL